MVAEYIGNITYLTIIIRKKIPDRKEEVEKGEKVEESVGYLLSGDRSLPRLVTSCCPCCCSGSSTLEIVGASCENGQMLFCPLRADC